MYQDKEKQRIAVKEATRRYRQQKVSPKALQDVIPKPPEVVDGKYNRAYLPGGQYYSAAVIKMTMATGTSRAPRSVPAAPGRPIHKSRLIWGDKRNQQGQPGLYGDWPDRTKTEAM